MLFNKIAQKGEACRQCARFAGVGLLTNELFEFIREKVATVCPSVVSVKPIYRDFRPGDILHSLANIDKAKMLLGYDPQYSVQIGLEKVGRWYLGDRSI